MRLPVSSLSVPATGTVQGRVSSDLLNWCLFFAAHVPLALLMRQVQFLSTLHLVLTLGVGFWCAAVVHRPQPAAYVAAYIAGAEVLWRMTGAQAFWELGKYATIAILFVAIVRFHKLAGFSLPLIYFILLLPSAILTVAALGLIGARDQVSFNLSGPLALAVSAWFFSRLSLSQTQLHRVMLTLVGPVVGIGSIALYSTLTASYASLDFTQESNVITSGGFGPNQVSNMLGLGALFSFIYVLREKQNRVLRLVMLAGVITLGTLSALTFSRSGLYNAGAAAIAFALVSARDMRALLRLLLVAGVLIIAADAYIIPRLEEFTKGQFSVRFQDTSLGQRADIAEADLRIWENNLLFGVGPGMAKQYRGLSIGQAAAHTELSRMLAEHGLFGLIALILLAAMGVRNLRYAANAQDRALVTALQVWTLLFFLNSAMRMVAPSFVFGLAFAVAAAGQAHLLDNDTRRDAPAVPLPASQLPARGSLAGYYADTTRERR